MTSVMDFILQRRSVRRFLERPVREEDLLALLEAAMAAPSACNSRPWEFVVITDPLLIKEFRTHLEFGNYNAPAAIAICGNPSVARNACAVDYWVQDCSAAAENLLIAAAGMDLGAVWLGIYPSAERMALVSRVLDLPSEASPLCLIFVGHPEAVPPPRTQFDEHRVYWQKYFQRKLPAKPSE